MKTSASTIVVALALLLILQNSSIIAADRTKICSSLEGFDFGPDECTSILSADPRSAVADDHDLATIAIDILIANATHVQSRAQELSEDEFDPTVKLLTESCSKEYSERMPSLRSAKLDAAAENYGRAADKIFAFRDAPWNCDAGFRSRGIKNLNPIEDENNIIATDPIALAYSINRYMQHP